MKTIKPGEPTRGGSIGRPDGMSAWQGHDWNVAHGPAVISYMHGKPKTVANCLLPDGTRSDAFVSLDHENVRDLTLIKGPRIWARETGGRRMFGVLEVRDDDVAFKDQPELSRRPEGKMTGLAADLFGDAEIIKLVQDRAFAEDLYRAICNTTWKKGEEEWDLSWRSAGGLVADLRNLNESYTDFYCSDNEGIVAELVHAHFTRLGWQLLEGE